MWPSMMPQWQYEMYRWQNRGRGENDEAAYASLPVARAGRNGLLHRAVEWLARQAAAWEALQEELDRPSAGRHPVPSGEPIGGAL